MEEKKGEDQHGASNFDHLPQELLVGMFATFTPSQLATASLVSQHWNATTTDDILWRRLHKLRWREKQARANERMQLLHAASSSPSFDPSSDSDGTWKALYQKHHRGDTLWAYAMKDLRESAPNGHKLLKKWPSGTDLRRVRWGGADGTLWTCAWDGSIKEWVIKSPSPKEEDLKSSSPQVTADLRRTLFQPGGRSVHCFEFGMCKKNVTTLGGEDKRVYGRRLLSADLKGGLHLWDISVGEEVAEGDNLQPKNNPTPIKQFVDEGKQDLTSPAGCIRFLSEKEDAFATGDNKGYIKVWDTQTGQSRHCFVGHAEGVVCLEAGDGSDGRLLLSGSCDLSLKLWDIRTSCQAVYTMTGKSISTLAVNPSARNLIFASGTADGDIDIWDIRKIDEPVKAWPESHGQLSGLSRPVWALQWRNETTLLSTSPQDFFLRIWDTLAPSSNENYTPPERLHIPLEAGVKVVDFAVDGEENRVAIINPARITIIRIGEEV